MLGATSFDDLVIPNETQVTIQANFKNKIDKT